MMAAEREIVEEAYAGDIIGVFDPGLFSIGDTVTVPGKKFKYSGIPTFEPEHFMRVSPVDTNESASSLIDIRIAKKSASSLNSPAPGWRRLSWAWWARCNLTCSSTG